MVSAAVLQAGLVVPVPLVDPFDPPGIDSHRGWWWVTAGRYERYLVGGPSRSCQTSREISDYGE